MMQARASKAAAAATKRVPLKPAGGGSSSRAVTFLHAACSFGLRRRPAGAVFYPIRL